MTVADFTVETFFTDELWHRYIQREDVKDLSNRDKIEAFEKELRLAVTRMIENEKSVLSSDSQPNLKIAHINFAFENVKLLNLLTKRGALITNGKIDKLP